MRERVDDLALAVAWQTAIGITTAPSPADACTALAACQLARLLSMPRHRTKFAIWVLGREEANAMHSFSET